MPRSDAVWTGDEFRSKIPPGIPETSTQISSGTTRSVLWTGNHKVRNHVGELKQQIATHFDYEQRDNTRITKHTNSFNR